jgi:hypothetical protein
MSRRRAAREVGLAASTIEREVERDRLLYWEVTLAERAGAYCRELLEKFTRGVAVVMEEGPVVSTPSLEFEKEFLIEKGLPRAWVSRFRERTQAEWDAFHQACQEVDNHWFAKPTRRQEKAWRKSKQQEEMS